MKTVKINMTWQSTLMPLLAVYEGGTAEGRKLAIAELQRMAGAADLDLFVSLEDLPTGDECGAFYRCPLTPDMFAGAGE